MNLWTKYPFLRYTIFLIIGISFFQHYATIWNENWKFLLSLPLYSLPFLFLKNIKVRYIARGLFLLSFILLIGVVVASWNSDNLLSSHYSHQEKIGYYQIRISSDHTERTDYLRYEGEVIKVLSDSAKWTSGTIFLYVRKDSTTNIFKYGDVLNVNGSIYEIPSPQNPHEFNYRAYLIDQNIFGHSFVNATDIEFKENNPSNLILKYSYQIRSWAREVIITNIDSEREQSVLLALIIGINDYLDNELKTAYSSAGAMHVLAVSGLHVGIVYQIIVILFSFIKRVRFGTWLFVGLTVTAIWMYALVTGFTPSVLRASLMFTIILLSEHTGRKSNIYNSLGLAAFILILINPNHIYSVGFQLSFIAVFGIVFFHPLFYRQFYFGSKVMSYLWSITCVSLAAQVATFPLTIYYFHQFPTYFLISNLIVIPAAMVMLVLGILMLILSVFIPFVAAFLGDVLTWVVWVLNESIQLLQQLPRPIIDWLYFDAVDTWLVYGTLLFVALGLSQGVFQKLTFGLLLLVIFNIKWFIIVNESLDQERLVFYEIRDHIAFDIIQGNQSKLVIDKWSDEESERIGFQINPNRLASHLSPVKDDWSMMENSSFLTSSDLGKLFIWKGKRILFYEPTAAYALTDSIAFDLIYMNEFQAIDPKIKPTTILLGANLKSWHKTKLEKAHPNINIHSLYMDGYFEYQR
ncbi:MAG: ComEC/Rec2 family competence protein [Cyclobacteriaceae bacterium]